MSVFRIFRSGYSNFVYRLGHQNRVQSWGSFFEGSKPVSGEPMVADECVSLEDRGIHHTPKTCTLAEIRRPRKWQQMGQQIHQYENLLTREFHVDKPNTNWVADIFYIQTGQGVLYLSIIRNLYDNSIMAYKTAPAGS